MRRLFTFLLALGLVVALFALFATSPAPLVSRSPTISTDAVAAAKRLFRFNDPRRMQPGQPRRVSVPVQLIDEGLNHLATRFINGRAALDTEAKRVRIKASAALPFLPIKRYLDLQVLLVDDGKQLQLDEFKLARISLPPRAALPLIGFIATLSGQRETWLTLVRTVERIRLSTDSQSMVFDIVWQPALLQQARALALSGSDTAQLEAAQRDLAALLGFRASRQPIRLPEILKPMLDIKSDALTARRRAALLVMASYLAGKDLTSVVPEAASWPRPAPRLLVIHGREDSAQHFVISAALSAWAGEPIADAIGLYKELEDARSGSGFSFPDLAADRAGTRFGRLLIDKPARIDALLAGTLQDSDLVPALNDLPEFISEAEFRRRFGTIESPAYRSLIDEVERRISAGPLYR